MVQDAYQRLVEALCGPDVGYRCADPSQNRLLPLLALFHTLHNLTIQAFGQEDTLAGRVFAWLYTDMIAEVISNLFNLAREKDAALIAVQEYENVGFIEQPLRGGRDC